MPNISVKLLGTGDAFHTGGRLHTAFSLRCDGYHALIDCGATTLAFMRHLEVDVAGIDAIVLSHLHGDHFGGVPFILMDACYNARRNKPLTIAGPQGSRLRITDTLGCLYPGAPAKVDEKVPLEYLEYRDRQPLRVGPLDVLPVPVVHPSGASAYALRISAAGRTLAFSGDAEWSAAVSEVAAGADLFICECCGYDRPIPFHMHYAQLKDALPAVRAKRIILSHLGPDALAHASELAFEVGEDGMDLEL